MTSHHFTVTFDATDSDVVSIAGDTLTFNNHRFVTGQKVTYNDGGGTAIGGLSDGSYFIIKEDQNTIKLASSASNATSGTAIDLTSGAAGGSHTLNIAQDGVNTKFKATHSNGTKAKISRAAQITLSINGVIQQQETKSYCWIIVLNQTLQSYSVKHPRQQIRYLHHL